MLPARWAFKIKRAAQGSIERYNARLVVKGFMQQEGVGFIEVCAPTRIIGQELTFRALLATGAVVVAKLELHQVDVKRPFSKGIWMRMCGDELQFWLTGFEALNGFQPNGVVPAAIWLW
jgi:hypothetical protein